MGIETERRQIQQTNIAQKTDEQHGPRF